MLWVLLTTPSFLLSFIINTVLPFVIHEGIIAVFKQACKCFASRSCKSVILLNQNPFTPSGPGAFQFDIPETRFWMFTTVILISSCFSTSANSCFIFCNHLASWLWLDGTLQIFLQNL